MTRRAHTSSPRRFAAGAALRALMLLVLFMVQACSNSILRNAAEAGLETALDSPLPTPTPR